MTISITPMMLYELCGGKFTYEGAEAICELFADGGADCAPTIGDICVSFGEVPADDIDYGTEVYTFLRNGNAIICY